MSECLATRKLISVLIECVCCSQRLQRTKVKYKFLCADKDSWFLKCTVILFFSGFVYLFCVRKSMMWREVLSTSLTARWRAVSPCSWNEKIKPVHNVFYITPGSVVVENHEGRQTTRRKQQKIEDMSSWCKSSQKKVWELPTKGQKVNQSCALTCPLARGMGSMRSTPSA